jgi:predicted PurR-regulated permease PerM
MVGNTARGVMFSEVLTGVVQASLTLIALFALQVPGAFLWGVLAFVLSFIPLLGTAPVTIGATIYLFAADRPAAGVIMLIAVFIVGISDNLVRPFTQSSVGQMHPLLSLLAIFGGLATIGAGGVFLGPIIAALAWWTFEYYGHKAN